MAVINGTSGDDLLNGTANDDIIRGRAGDDTLNGGAGDDRLLGGAGSDSLFGGDGDDIITPGTNSFFDYIDAGAGIDIIDFSTANGAQAFYNIANDGLNAGISATVDGVLNTGAIDKGINGTTTLVDVANALAGLGVRLIGTGFDDVFTINPGSGSIQIRGQGGNDTIVILAGPGEVVLDFRNAAAGVNVNLATGIVANDGFGDSDTITGPGQVTWLRGSSLDDILRGSGNDEEFTLYGGSDTLNAGGGFDTLRYNYFGNRIVDTLEVDLEAGTATGNLNGVAFAHTINGIEQVVGSDSGNDILRGSASQGDVLQGGGGNDTLSGRRGNDTLEGGKGKDALNGDLGADRLFGGLGNDKLSGGKGGDMLNGGKGRDILKGGLGKDSLDGGGGSDKMTGGGGADTFIFSAGDDVITDFNAANNREKIDLSDVASIKGFRDLRNNHVTQDGADLVIDDKGGNTLTLEGLTISDLDRGDFIF